MKSLRKRGSSKFVPTKKVTLIAFGAIGVLTSIAVAGSLKSWVGRAKNQLVLMGWDDNVCVEITRKGIVAQLPLNSSAQPAVLARYSVRDQAWFPISGLDNRRMPMPLADSIMPRLPIVDRAALTKVVAAAKD